MIKLGMTIEKKTDLVGVTFLCLSRTHTRTRVIKYNYASKISGKEFLFKLILSQFKLVMIFLLLLLSLIQVTLYILKYSISTHFYSVQMLKQFLKFQSPYHGTAQDAIMQVKIINTWQLVIFTKFFDTKLRKGAKFRE